MSMIAMRNNVSNNAGVRGVGAASAVNPGGNLEGVFEGVSKALRTFGAPSK